MKCSAILLCGGRGRRVGGADKGRLPWGQRSMAEAVLERIAPQVDDIVISANRNRDWYQSLGYPVVADLRAGFQGPLAGLEAALPLCGRDTAMIVCCDNPSLPLDLARRLGSRLEDAGIDVCHANDGDRDQYLTAMLRTSLRDSLVRYLDAGQHSVRGWYRSLRCASVDFSDQRNAFTNINQLNTKNPPRGGLFDNSTDAD
jgi:molybdopterin-guanine dinucleotide biosynthesis protein A